MFEFYRWLHRLQGHTRPFGYVKGYGQKMQAISISVQNVNLILIWYAVLIKYKDHVNGYPKTVEHIVIYYGVTTIKRDLLKVFIHFPRA